MNGALSVPQRQISVRVELLDGRSLTGVMYVPAVGPDHEPCRLIDHLETSQEFLALTDSERTHLIRLASIAVVHVDDGEVEELARKQIEGSRRSRDLLVTLRLTTGAELIGHVIYVQPSESARLLDYLNSGRRFLELQAESRQVYVNRAQIVSVFELSQSPPPIE